MRFDRPLVRVFLYLDPRGLFSYTGFFVPGVRRIHMAERLLRLKQVLELVPVGKSTWWAGVASGKFPAGRKLTERTTVWKESDILAIVNDTWGKDVAA